MPQKIWTIVSTSEVGTTIYPQDTASTTDRATAVAWAQTELENDVTIMAIEIDGAEVRNVTKDITEDAAKLTMASYEAKGFMSDEMPDWVKATDAFDTFEAGMVEKRSHRRNDAWDDYRACIEIGLRGL